MFTLLGRARSAGLSMESYSPILSRFEYGKYVYPTRGGAPAGLSREHRTRSILSRFEYAEYVYLTPVHTGRRPAGLSREPYLPLLSRLEYAEYVYPTQDDAAAGLSREPYSQFRPLRNRCIKKRCQNF